MRLLLTILLFPFFSSATNYYVSNSGSDGANGLTTGTAWQTLAKVNASTFASGDSILLKRGDTWNEKLRLSNNGVIVASYGTGLKPVITGFVSLTMTTEGANIWTGTATNSVGTGVTNALNTYAKQNTILIDGQLRAKGRYPNSSFLTTISNTSANSLTTEQSISAFNFTGGEVVVKIKQWVTDVTTISSHSTSTLSYYPALSYANTGRISLFIQNHPSVLDQQYEWSFDSATKLLSVYSTTSPSVQYSSIDTLVYLNGADNVTFYNIKFTGANMIALSFDGSDNLTVKNCTFENNGFNALQGYPSNNAVILNDSILNTWNDAVRVFGQKPLIQGNYVYNTGTKEGMGGSGNGMYMGFYAGSVGVDSLKVVSNTLRNVGYNGIYFEGTKSLIYRNRIDSFCTIKDDGGAIYAFNNTSQNSVVRSNILTNGIGQITYAAGIYMDQNVGGVTLDSNTISNTGKAGIHMNVNSTGANPARYNLITNSVGDGITTFGGASFVIKRNTVHVTGSFYCFNGTVSGTIDSNYHLKPSNESVKFRNAGTNTTYSLSGWQGLGYDVNGGETPSNITGTTPTLYSNATQSDSTISFSGWKKDARGNQYPGSVTLPPFSSALLFPIATPTIPYIKRIKVKRVL